MLNCKYGIQKTVKKEIFFALLKEGMTIPEIAKELNLSARTLYTWRKKENTINKNNNIKGMISDLKNLIKTLEKYSPEPEKVIEDPIILTNCIEAFNNAWEESERLLTDNGDKFFYESVSGSIKTYLNEDGTIYQEYTILGGIVSGVNITKEKEILDIIKNIEY